MECRQTSDVTRVSVIIDASKIDVLKSGERSLWVLAALFESCDERRESTLFSEARKAGIYNEIANPKEKQNTHTSRQ